MCHKDSMVRAQTAMVCTRNFGSIHWAKDRTTSLTHINEGAENNLRVCTVTSVCTGLIALLTSPSWLCLITAEQAMIAEEHHKKGCQTHKWHIDQHARSKNFGANGTTNQPLSENAVGVESHGPWTREFFCEIFGRFFFWFWELSKVQA